MPSNPTYLRDRLLEATTVARAADLTNQLTALTVEESAKRYAATRPQRRQLAMDIINVAQAIVDRLAVAPATPRKRTPKPVVAKPEEPAAAVADS